MTKVNCKNRDASGIAIVGEVGGQQRPVELLGVARADEGGNGRVSG